MKEKLVIHNFAGISDIELELNDINILIGPQATGKSICAKSLYYFKSFTSDIFSAVRNNKSINEFNEMFIEKFKEYFPPPSWTASFSIKYEIDCESDENLFIQIKKQSKSTSKIRLTYSDYYRTLYETLFEEFSSLRKDSFLDHQSRNTLFMKEYELNQVFQEKLKNRVGTLGNLRQLFIPAGRSFFGILQSSIFTFLATNTTIDPFLKSFGSFLERIKGFESDFDFDSSERITKRNVKRTNIKEQVDKLIEAILKGKYVYEKGKDYLLFQDGRKTLLANASSGQQETLPLALILRRLVLQAFYSPEGYTIYIEEPEAHIFPTAQKEIVQLISLVYNVFRMEEPFQFVITTHSPYILTEFNNLLFAGIVEEKLKRKNKTELYKIVPKEQILKPNRLKCYSLDNGTCQSILSQNTGLITSDIIDAVSDDFSIQFGKLLDLDSKI